MEKLFKILGVRMFLVVVSCKNEIKDVTEAEEFFLQAHRSRELLTT